MASRDARRAAIKDAARIVRSGAVRRASSDSLVTAVEASIIAARAHDRRLAATGPCPTCGYDLRAEGRLP